MKNEVVSYGFDRIKLSVANARIRTGALHHLDYKGSEHGFNFYGDSQLRVGLSDSYIVFEFYALWFLNSVSSMSEAWSSCLAYVENVCERWESPKPSRIDIYVDRKCSSVKPLTVDMYKGKARVKVGQFGGVAAETSYLFAQSRTWTIRRYDKSREIKDNQHEHRYSEAYAEGVVRTEAQYTKDYFKQLKERTFENAISYIVKNMRETTLPELHFLAERVEEEIGQGVIVYKQSNAGERNGERTKQRIYRYLENLHRDFVAVAGDDREFFSELAKLGRKEISIHV
ncbi:MAG: hypothetical protein RBT70_10120 [Alphaproteobacteria bacterium]|nr:hypothetical protein [Alphaproteobacteria bacterium]